MLLALALYASTAHAGIPAGFGGTPGVVNEKTCVGAPLGVKARRARAGSSLGPE